MAVLPRRPAALRAAPGPLEARCVAAGSRARLRPGMAALSLTALGPQELRAARGLHVGELTLLADFVHTVPRVTGRWMLELARAQGVDRVLADVKGLPEAEAAALLGRELGWATDSMPARSAVLGLLEHLAELQLLAKHDGAYSWRGEGVVRDLALAPDEEAHARELFGGTLAFYRACVERLPEVLRGKPGTLGFGPEHAALWEGVLGDAVQLVLRRLGLKATEGRPQAVLDLACGPGYSTALVAEEWPGSSIVALDLSDATYPAVEERVKASALASGVPADLTLAKPWPGYGEALPFPDASFDAVFFPLNDGFIPPHRRRDAYAEMRRVLKPGGQLVVVSAFLPDDEHRARAWELRAQTWFHHTSEFAVAGFQGLARAGEHLAATAGAGFAPEPHPKRFGGLVWVHRAP